MNNDTKATVTAIATGVVSLVGLFGLNLPLETVTVIVSIGIMILGFFTNKPDKVKQPEE